MKFTIFWVPKWNAIWGTSLAPIEGAKIVTPDFVGPFGSLAKLIECAWLKFMMGMYVTTEDERVYQKYKNVETRRPAL
jgi:hypothetical protein